MTTTTSAPSTARATARPVLDRAVLDRAVAAMAARRQAEVDLLESALAWAHAHVPTNDDEVAGWQSDTMAVPGTYAAAMFGERAVGVAGVGTPAVAEFAVMELAAALRVSHEAALALVGDVLDLAHRLPRLWALVRSCGSRRIWGVRLRGSRVTSTSTRPLMRTGCWCGSPSG